MSASPHLAGQCPEFWFFRSTFTEKSVNLFILLKFAPLNCKNRLPILQFYNQEG
jgi:hypothetical protein